MTILADDRVRSAMIAHADEAEYVKILESRGIN